MMKKLLLKKKAAALDAERTLAQQLVNDFLDGDGGGGDGGDVGGGAATSGSVPISRYDSTVLGLRIPGDGSGIGSMSSDSPFENPFDTPSAAAAAAEGPVPVSSKMKQMKRSEWNACADTAYSTDMEQGGARQLTAGASASSLGGQAAGDRLTARMISGPLKLSTSSTMPFSKAARAPRKAMPLTELKNTTHGRSIFLPSLQPWHSHGCMCWRRAAYVANEHGRNRRGRRSGRSLEVVRSSNSTASSCGGGRRSYCRRSRW